MLELHDVFDWWAGIWLPLIGVVTSFLVGAAALTVSVVALRTAREAERREKRADRLEVANRLREISRRTVRAITRGLPDEALEAVYSESSIQSLGGSAMAKRIADQLLAWLMIVQSRDLDDAARFAINVDIVQHVNDAIATWALAEDPESISFETHGLDDLAIGPDPANPDVAGS